MDIPWAEIWSDILDVMLYIPQRIWELLLEGLAALLVSIPAPDWFSNVSTLWNLIPSGVSYFFYLFNIATGIGILLGAWVIRFLIRRIPLIG